MKGIFRVCILFATAALAGALVPTPSLSQNLAAGTAQGDLKGMSKTFPLRFAYALEIDDVEGILGRGIGKKSIVIELTDVELPPDAVGDWSRCEELARVGKLNGVEIHLDAATNRVNGGKVYYATTQGKPTGHTISFPVLSSDPGYTIKNLKIERDTISGIALNSAAESKPTAADKDGFSFYYNATFNANLAHQPPVTAVLTGPAARTSPQVQVLLAFDTIWRKGDIEAAKRLSTPAANKRTDAIIAQMGKGEFVSMMQDFFSFGKTTRRKRLKQIMRVVVRGTKATVVFGDKDAINSVSLLNVNGVWLMN